MLALLPQDGHAGGVKSATKGPAVLNSRPILGEGCSREEETDRERISSAALLVKVTARIFHGFARQTPIR